MVRLSKDVLSDLVYEQLVKMLLNKDLAPGEKVLKKELAKVLQVSMTPVSEAINRLIREGILELTDKREIFVKEFDNSDMIELFEMRSALEGTALRICMEKLSDKEWEKILKLFDSFSTPLEKGQYNKYQRKDREFHSTILKMSGNHLMLEFIERCDFIIRCYSNGLIRAPEETLMEHLDIIDSIRSKDTDAAERKLMQHHWKTREKLKVNS